MDFKLTDQQRRMIATVRDLVEAEFKPNARKYMDGTFPWPNMKKLAEIGVLGMSVPEEYGGLGGGPFDVAVVMEEFGKALVVEKTPKHVHALARIRRLLPGARFVGLVRNPLDTCLSLKLRTKGRDWGGLDYAIERWLIDTGAVADLRGDPRALVLRYEDLTSAPERELRRLAAFLDLPWHRSMLDATDSAYASIRQRTATMRLRADQVRQPIRPNSGKWRSGLTPDEIATVRERTAALWARLGGGPDGASYLAEGPVNQG